MNYSNKHIFNFLLTMIVFAACKKSNFLETKPDQSLVVPTTLSELQGLLDNDIVMNGGGNFGVTPSLGEIGADNYYIKDDDFNNFTPLQRNAYTWEKKLYAGEDILDWNYPYRAVFYANVVLEGLEKLSVAPDQRPAWNNCKGIALFNRAHNFYALAQIFAPPYQSNSAPTDPGIPLRMQADIGETMQRATLEKTYQQIISDLQNALQLLPNTEQYKSRPSRPAAYALLARTFQTMQQYDKALLYADSCLQLENTLIDFNTLDSTQSFPIARFNDEVLFNCVNVGSSIVLAGRARVDSILYNSYQDGDLRKSNFFKPGGSRGGWAFKGSYDGSPYQFGGIATDEVYLIRAEAYARTGNTTQALQDLNTLMLSRWRTGSYNPYTATSADQALQFVLSERRKELIFRGLRWTDLRRLNQESQFAVNLTRMVLGQTYTLPAMDLRYTYSIPDKVISFNPTMAQNPR